MAAALGRVPGEPLLPQGHSCSASTSAGNVRYRGLSWKLRAASPCRGEAHHSLSPGSRAGRGDPSPRDPSWSGILALLRAGGCSCPVHVSSAAATRSPRVPHPASPTACPRCSGRSGDLPRVSAGPGGRAAGGLVQQPAAFPSCSPCSVPGRGVRVRGVAAARGRAGPREGLKLHPQSCGARLGEHGITAFNSSSYLLAKADFL